MPRLKKNANSLSKYLNECRRGKDKKADTSHLQQRTGDLTTERVGATVQVTEVKALGKDRKFPQAPGGFVVTPDIPLDEL